MVQSFLLIQLKKEKDNPGLNQQSLAQIIANSFNKQAYIRQKIIQQEWSQIKNYIIFIYKSQKAQTCYVVDRR